MSQNQDATSVKHTAWHVMTFDIVQICEKFCQTTAVTEQLQAWPVVHWCWTFQAPVTTYRRHRLQSKRIAQTRQRNSCGHSLVVLVLVVLCLSTETTWQHTRTHTIFNLCHFKSWYTQSLICWTLQLRFYVFPSIRQHLLPKTAWPKWAPFCTTQI